MEQTANTPTTTTEGLRLRQRELHSVQDVLQQLLEVIQLQRECVNQASPEKKSIELKRLAASIKVYHQYLMTLKSPEPNRPANHHGAVSKILLSVFSKSQRPKAKARHS